MSTHNNPKIEVTEPSLAGDLYVLDEDIFCNIYAYNFSTGTLNRLVMNQALQTLPHTQYAHVSRCSHQRISSHLNMVHGSFFTAYTPPPPSFPLHTSLESARPN